MIKLSKYNILNEILTNSTFSEIFGLSAIHEKSKICDNEMDNNVPWTIIIDDGSEKLI